MNIKQALTTLKKDIDALTKAHTTIQNSLELLAKQIEIARHNLAVLQDAFMQGIDIKTAVPVKPAGRLN